MKLNNKLIKSMLLFVIALFIGCASTGMKRSEKATISMKSMENDIKLAAVQLDATNSSLDELMRSGQTDVKTAFDLFSNNIEKISSIQSELAKHSDEMKAKGKDYFEEWQKEGDKYKNKDIQILSDQRRSELSEIYNLIVKSNLGVRNAFLVYISDIKEIQIYLSNDLTAKGIEVIVPISKKVVNDGDNLKYAIKNVQSAIDNARIAMSQGTK